jgi:hypothetical protein
MNKIKNFIAGLSGAIALNILHETLKAKKQEVPRIDLLGEEALQKTLGLFDTQIKDKTDLFKATLTGDVISNALYYSLIGSGDKYVWPKAIVLGLTAGIGAINLPEPMGLDPEPVTRTPQIKALTVGYYVFGALVTGVVLKMLKKH